MLKHLFLFHKSYKLKPLMRNHKLYELTVYSGNKNEVIPLQRLLESTPWQSALAKNLCPGLGTKGSIPYDEVTLSNLASMRNCLLDYMKQDILLLGGVMQKAQDIYWKLYKLDIESKITLCFFFLALSIFRMRYYDASAYLHPKQE